MNVKPGDIVYCDKYGYGWADETSLVWFVADGKDVSTAPDKMTNLHVVDFKPHPKPGHIEVAVYDLIDPINDEYEYSIILKRVQEATKDFFTPKMIEEPTEGASKVRVGSYKFIRLADSSEISHWVSISTGRKHSWRTICELGEVSRGW